MVDEIQRLKSAERARKWYAANRERAAEKNRKYYIANREKINEYVRKYKSVNRGENSRERERKYYANNREREAERKRKYRAARLESRASRPKPDFCEACGNLPNGQGALHFDHCHLLGLFRGWLCNSCNVSLGLLKHNPKRLKQLIVYLEKYDI